MDNGTTKIQDQHRPTENMDKYGTFGTRFYWLHIWDRPTGRRFVCFRVNWENSGDLPSGDHRGAFFAEKTPCLIGKSWKIMENHGKS